jgi:hypothetical protein
LPSPNEHTDGDSDDIDAQPRPKPIPTPDDRRLSRSSGGASRQEVDRGLEGARLGEKHLELGWKGGMPRVSSSNQRDRQEVDRGLEGARLGENNLELGWKGEIPKVSPTFQGVSGRVTKEFADGGDVWLKRGTPPAAVTQFLGVDDNYAVSGSRALSTESRLSSTHARTLNDNVAVPIAFDPCAPIGLTYKYNYTSRDAGGVRYESKWSSAAQRYRI